MTVQKFLVKQKFPMNLNEKNKKSTKNRTENGSKTFKISDTMVACSIQLVAIDYVPQFLSFLFRKAFLEVFFFRLRFICANKKVRNEAIKVEEKRKETNLKLKLFSNSS